MFRYAALFEKKLIVLQHGDNTFLFYFDMLIKLTLSAMILTKEKSHLMFELHYKTTFLIKISYKKHVTRQNCFVIAKLEKLSTLKSKGKKNPGIIPVIEVLIFATVNTFSCRTGFRYGII